MRLEGKAAIITGAASGIGRSIAQRFTAEGARVVIADLEQAHPEAAAAEIAALTGGQVLGMPMDVTNEEAVESAVARTVHAYGRVDILCSNAGNQIIGGIHELSYSDWKKIMAVHLDGAFLTTRACLRHMYRLRARRQHPLHWFGPFKTCLGSESTVCDCQARNSWAVSHCGQRRGALWRSS
jgi:3-hydroxybutyrate dehydrogenase